MVPPLLDLTEEDIYLATWSFLTQSVATGTEVIRGQVNRVPEPASANFVVMTVIRRERIETNETSYRDYDVTGSISGSVLTVDAVGHGALESGMLLRGTSGLIAVDTVVLGQLSGSAGGTGTYRVSGTQVIGSGVIYAGLRDDLVAAQLTIQLDVHGPDSTDNVTRISTLFRSEVGVDSFEASGFAVAPLYCNDGRQLPFVNAENQYEDRWVLEAVLQISPTVSTPQQFADEVEVTTIEVDTTYPP